jgi:hypothetical protein
MYKSSSNALLGMPSSSGAALQLKCKVSSTTLKPRKRESSKPSALVFSELKRGLYRPLTELVEMTKVLAIADRQLIAMGR